MPSGSFNSRARKGRDVSTGEHVQGAAVSIHAPVKGATSQAELAAAEASCFNSRARKGRDWQKVRAPSSRVGFNSRARKGRDVADVMAKTANMAFQFTRP